MKLRIGSVVAAAVTTLMVGGGIVAAPPAAHAQDEGCVTGLSLLLDAAEVGSAAGPPIVFSTGISVVGIALPPSDSPLAPVAGPAFSEFAAVFREATTAVSEGGVDFAEQMRAVIAPLSAGSEQGDASVHQIAELLDALADTLGPAVQPADRTMHQTAAMLRISSCRS